MVMRLLDSNGPAAGLSSSRYNDSQTHSEMEDYMDTSLALFLGLGWIGLGTFFMGVGVLWWVSILAREKKE
jgi:hypothetical protein